MTRHAAHSQAATLLTFGQPVLQHIVLISQRQILHPKIFFFLTTKNLKVPEEIQTDFNLYFNVEDLSAYFTKDLTLKKSQRSNETQNLHQTLNYQLSMHMHCAQFAPMFTPVSWYLAPT